MERIHYLRKYTSGDARETIEGTFYFSSEDAYREILEKKHGNHFTSSDAFRDRLHEWPKVTGRNSEGLRRYGDFLRQCQMAMENIKVLEILNSCRENKRVAGSALDKSCRKYCRFLPII